MPPSRARFTTRPSRLATLQRLRTPARTPGAAALGWLLFVSIGLVGWPSPAAAGQGFDPSQARLVDLTHPFNIDTVYWPSTPSGFVYVPVTSGVTQGGWYYSAGGFQAAEHGGTHVDAPVHFKEGAESIDKMALRDLIAPVFVVDVSSNASMSPDYEVAVPDILGFEARYGPIPRGSIVLVRTGWSSRWPDRKAYLGDDTPGDASNLHFPGFGAEAARILVQQRGVAAIGIDTASLDPGRSGDFQVHRLAAEAGVPGFENLTNLDQLPAKGAWLLALPMLIENGTGAPLRAVAMIPAGR